jgi:ApbE superfamily uncharacterized protein (UPF0280 family)
MPALARMLPDGKRLHLNHGPIDLIVYADGPRAEVERAYKQATERFQTVLQELVEELTLLRQDIPQGGLGLKGSIAKRMEKAVQPHWASRVTPMAAVAGSVAEEMLQQLCEGISLRRAYINNGGDIALHLEAGEGLNIASPSGTIFIHSFDAADVAATLIANAVNLPKSPKVQRQKANEVTPDSDLKDRLVTIDVLALDDAEKEQALNKGKAVAEILLRNDQILGASLNLQGQTQLVSKPDHFRQDSSST